MASLSYSTNKNGMTFCVIRASCKDANGDYKQYTKRIVNNNYLSIAKFKKQCEIESITFEQEIRAQVDNEIRITNEILTFPQLMDEFIDNIENKLSISYLIRATDVKNHFYPYLKENHLYNKPLTEITVRDVQKFLDSFTTYIQSNGNVKLKKPLPENVNFRELHREGIINRDSSYYMNKLNGNIRKETAIKICKYYHLDFDKYFKDAGIEKRYSIETIKGFRRVLRTVFNEAIRYGWISRNPASLSKIITKGNNSSLRPVAEKEVFSIKETKDFMAALDKIDDEFIYKRVCLKIMICTGVRQAEMAGLRWDDIDFEKQCIHIHRNRLYQPKNGYYEKEPKTKTSIRDIPIPDALLDDLHKYHDWFLLADPDFDYNLEDYYVASNVYREPIANQTMAKWLEQVEKQAGLKHVSCHGLRHTYCSLLLSQNVPIQTVSKYMGHSDSTITLKVYSHFIPESQERIINAMNNILN